MKDTNQKNKTKKNNNGRTVLEKKILHRTYSRPLLGATIALNLVHWVSEKIVSLEMVKNDMSLGDASKQNSLFSENVPLKKALMPPRSRIAPASVKQFSHQF